MRPLVTVAVVTYHSSAFVLETLQSVADQTYDNIALIVSDDGSRDDTVQVCQRWLDDHGDRFVSVQLLTVPENTGVSANCNRILAAAPSEWIKFIAGDDILLWNCIEDYVNFIAKKPEAKILFSQVFVFRNQYSSMNVERVVPEEFPANIMGDSLSASDQFKRLLVSDRINFTPSYFFHKQAILDVGGYDEKHRIVEDYPMWLRLTKAGYRLDFMPLVTVAYRQHNQSINNKETRLLIKHSMLNTFSFRREYVHPYLPWDIAWGERVTMMVGVLFDSIGWNQDKWFFRKAYLILTIYVNPFKYFSFVKKRFFVTDPVFYA